MSKIAYDRLHSELTFFRDSFEKKISAAMSSIESEIGLSVTNEYCEANGQEEFMIRRIGDIGIFMTLERLKYLDEEAIDLGLKKIKENPEKKEEVISELKSEVRSGTTVSVVKACLATRKSRVELTQLLRDYLQICELQLERFL